MVAGRVGAGLSFVAVVGFCQDVPWGAALWAPDGNTLATQLTGQRHVCSGQCRVDSVLGEDLAAKTCSCTSRGVAKPGAPPGKGWASGQRALTLLGQPTVALPVSPSPRHRVLSRGVPVGPPSAFGSCRAPVVTEDRALTDVSLLGVEAEERWKQALGSLLTTGRD